MYVVVPHDDDDDVDRKTLTSCRRSKQVAPAGRVDILF